eukprot:GILK01004068.1.p1 GENE.GILK01004068.1~~GILK01004068.1.p1  ORF type:complete len:572 (-),score=86.95 GILK01004068.1:399-2114(-)
MLNPEAHDDHHEEEPHHEGKKLLSSGSKDSSGIHTRTASEKRWLLSTLTTLFIGYMGYYVCRSDLTVTAPLILREWSESGIADESKFGLLLTLGTAAYSFGKISMGFLVDKLGGKRMFLAGMGFSILSTVMFSVVNSYPMFVFAWVLNRMAQSAGWGAVLKIVSGWCFQSEFSKVTSILALSYLFGDGVARLYLSSILEYYNSWRTVFLLAALFLSVIFAISLITIKDHPPGYVKPTATKPQYHELVNVSVSSDESTTDHAGSSETTQTTSSSTLKVSTPKSNSNTPSSSRRTLATADVSKIHISRQRSSSISVRGRTAPGDMEGDSTAEDETTMSAVVASGQTDVKEVGAAQVEKAYHKTDKHITKQQQDEAHISIFMVCVISIGLTFVQETVRDWAAIYLEARAGADDAVAGYITLAFPVMGGFSALLCSQFMKTQRQRTLVLLVAAVLCTASMVGLYLLERFYYDTTVPLVIVGILVSLVGLAVQGPLALVTALAVVEHGEETAGRLAGMLDGMMYIGGIVEGIAVGVLISKAGWSSVYLMAACVGLLTCFAVFRVMEKTFRRGVPSL